MFEECLERVRKTNECDKIYPPDRSSEIRRGRIVESEYVKGSKGGKDSGKGGFKERRCEAIRYSSKGSDKNRKERKKAEIESEGVCVRE